MKEKSRVNFFSQGLSMRRNGLFVIFIFLILVQLSCRKEILDISAPSLDDASLVMATNGSTYFVSPNGNDGASGDISNPWLTWQKAFNTAVAGDIVYFRGGEWTGATTAPRLNNKIGTHDRPICFYNYPGEKPEFDCSSYTATGDKIALGIDNSTYIKFRGLTVKNCQQIVNGQWISGISVVTCGNLYFDQVTITNTGGYGFWTSGYDTLYMINCDSYNNYDALASDPGNRADGFQISSGSEEGDYTFISGCRSWQNSDDGYEISTEREVHFINNWSFANGRLAYGNGIGVKIGPSLLSDPLKREFKNNVIANNKGFGISHSFLNDVTHGPVAVFYNNSIYKCSMGFNDDPGTYDCTSAGGNTVHRNNIVYGSTYYGFQAYLQSCEYQPEVGPVYNTADHNTWVKKMTSPYWQVNPALNVTDADFVSLDIASLSGARQPDGSLPVTNFMKLAAGSDLIDAGVNTGQSYSGSAPDLGWYESTSGSTTAVVPVYTSSAIYNATPRVIEMTYNSTLANVIPATSAFSVMVNSVARAVNSVSISGAKVLVTIASDVTYGNVVTVGYTKPATNPLQTASGGQAASITNQTVTNNVAASVVIPVYVSSSVASATPSTLEMTYNSTLANIVPGTSSFTVMVNSVTRTVNQVAISGTKVLLTLASPVSSGNTVNVSYIKPATNPLQSLSGGQAVTLSAQSVTNNCTLSTTNKSPVVSVSSPVNYSTYKSPAMITIKANASDSDGTISKVEFYNGSTKIGVSTTPPYSIVWKNVTTGKYTITATATDNLNSTTKSTPVSVTVKRRSFF
jgi:uncharacterized repeat protein (TIGR02059 family)